MYAPRNEPAIELLYKWNKSQDMLTVFPVITQMILIRDKPQTRGYHYENNEVSLGLEFNFF
jgi:hypothetical protein